MDGQRRKQRFIKRRSWGKIRADIRSKFSKGDYDIRAEWLRPSVDERWVTTDSSRMRWMLKHRGRRMGHWELEYHISVLRGDTSAIERKFGVFLYRCPDCGKRLWQYIHHWNCPAKAI